MVLLRLEPQSPSVVTGREFSSLLFPAAPFLLVGGPRSGSPVGIPGCVKPEGSTAFLSKTISPLLVREIPG